MNCRNLRLWTLLLTVNCLYVSAQTKTSFLLKKVQIKGLPSEAFYCTLEQDDDGFLWIGTISGLFRYDGSRITRFLRDPSDTNSLTHNYVTSLAKDKEGNIWIGTLSGFMNLYHRSTGRIERIEAHSKEPSKGNIRKLRLDQSQQHLLAGAAQSIYKITSTGQVVDSLFFIKAPARLNDFLEYKKDRFLVATSGGCFDIDWMNKQVREVFVTDETKDFRSIETDDNGIVWVGSDKGLFFLSAGNLKVVQPTKYNAIINEKLDTRSLKKDLFGRMWIGSSTGLFVQDNTIFQKVLLKDGTVNPANITTVFIDRNNMVWAGTSDKGLFQVHQPSLVFYSLPGIGLYSKKTLLQSIWEEKQGVWTIGTITGLYRYTFSTGKFEKIKLIEPDEDVQIASQMQDKKGGYWVATNTHGLFYRAPGNNSFIQFRNEEGNSHTLSNNNVLATGEDGIGYIWIGTYSGGTNISNLAYYSPVSKLINRIPIIRDDSTAFQGASISQIVKDRKNRLWIGSWGGGLYSYGMDDATSSQTRFTNYSEHSKGSKRISHNVVSCVKLAKDGRLWFGTVSGGLNCLDIEKNHVRWFTMKDGLPSNLVYRVEEDDQGFLWLSTDNGISRFDPSTESFMNYTKSSGLPAYNFSFLSSYKFKDGTLAFGTNDGQLVYFNPNNLKNFQNKQKTVITEIRLFNKTVGPGTGSILSKSPYLTDTIELTHDQSVISFDLANMDFINPENFTYAYKLEGFDKDWNYLTDRTSITYTNLDPGSYTLFVKNANHQGIWNEQPTKIVLIVKPPYWETWWFRALALLIMGTVVYLLFRYRLKQKLKIFAIRNRLHRDLHDDVGATLSSVKVYSEILGKNGNDAVITGLIKENATEMVERLEVISWATNPQYDNFKSLVDAMKKFARPLLHTNHILLDFEKNGFNDEMTIPGDVRQNLLLIFKEAVTNMVKYADAGVCHVKLLVKNNQCVLVIKDNGKGNDGVIKGGGAGVKNMHKRARDMNGSIEIKSGPGDGTSVQVTVPYPFKIPNSWGRNQRS